VARIRFVPNDESGVIDEIERELVVSISALR